MTRTKRSPVTASDVRRMGGQPLDLSVSRCWLDYAVHHATGGTLDALYAARRAAGDPLAVRLPEAAAKALAKLCEAAGRVNTAAAIRAAVGKAVQPPPPDPEEEFNATRHMEELARDGILSPEELADWKASRQRRSEAVGGPSDKGGLFGG